jgi:hypothetical protein
VPALVLPRIDTAAGATVVIAPAVALYSLASPVADRTAIVSNACPQLCTGRVLLLARGG